MTKNSIQGKGCRFKREPMGILPSIVLELDELRSEYKAKRKEALAEHGLKSSEYRKWDTAQLGVKRMRASLYGITGATNFGWYEKRIAENITHAGREALMKIVEKAEEWGFKVYYGDTDSIFVGVGDDLAPEEAGKVADKLGRDLTAYMQADLETYANTDSISVETEAVLDRMVMSTKKRYAGRYVWKPDTGTKIMEADADSRLKVTGLKMKQRKTPQIGKDAEKSAMMDIFDGKPIHTVLDNFKEYAIQLRKDYHDGKIPLESLCGRASLRKSIPKPENVNRIAPAIAKKHLHYTFGSSTEGVSKITYLSALQDFHKAAAWYNIHLSDDNYPPIEQDDSFYTVYVKDGPTWIPSTGMVAFQEVEQISDYEIDIDKVIDKNLFASMDSILTAFGYDKSVLDANKVRFTVEGYLGEIGK